MKKISANKILDFFKSSEKKDNKKVTKRFPFGEELKYESKVYRYLYTFGEDDVFFCEETTSIHLIPSKYVLPD